MPSGRINQITTFSPPENRKKERKRGRKPQERDRESFVKQKTPHLTQTSSTPPPPPPSNHSLGTLLRFSSIRQTNAAPIPKDKHARSSARKRREKRVGLLSCMIRFVYLHLLLLFFSSKEKMKKRQGEPRQKSVGCLQ
jgi:hypothetical protein